MKRERKVLYIVLAALALASLLMAGVASPALALANTTTVGSLTLSHSYSTIAVYANFSADDNENNSATLEYRKVGDPDWIQVIPFTVDRRDQYSYYNGDLGATIWKDNPWKDQYRAVIFHLDPDTQYEARVTFSDPDGVSGTNPVSDTTTTLDDNPPANGATYYVSPSGNDANDGLSIGTAWRTIQHAADNVSAGDIVKIASGTYNEEVRLSASGTPSNYIVFENYESTKPVIEGGGTRSHGVVIRGVDYVKLKGLIAQNPAGRCFLIDHGSTGIILDDCEGHNPGNAWADAGVLIRDGIDHNAPCTNGLIENSYFTCDDNRAEKYGIYVWGENTNWTFRNNVISGTGFKDGIGGTSTKEMYIHGNEVRSPWDDALEIEGANVNVGIWSNETYNDWSQESYFGKMGLGTAPVMVGPYYVFRNLFTDYRDAAIKNGNSSQGVQYFYHNTIYSTHFVPAWAVYGNNELLNNVKARNNIVYTGKYVIDSSANVEGWNEGWDFDYNDMYSTSESHFSKWKVGVDNRQQDFSEYRAATGFDSHGISADPRFVVPGDDGDFRLQSDSPCVDAGVILPGFNDENSPWPYQGSAPDIGAYESGYGSPPGPLHHIGITPGSVSLEVGQTQQFIATGYDQNNRVITGLSFTWSVVDPAAGSIDDSGLFTAGTVEGTYPDVVKTEAESIAGYASVSITMLTPNNAPVAVDDAYSVDENTTITVAAPGVLANDSDVDGDPLRAVLVSDVSNGTLTLNDDGSFSYTPAPDYTGSDSFTYVANDGQADSNIATVSITVNASSPPPPPGQTGTFGLDNGDGTWGLDAGAINGMKFACSDDGTLTKIGLLLDDASPSGNVKLAIYDHDATNDLPENLLWGGSNKSTTDGWMEWGTSPVQLSANATYWLVFWLDTQNDVRYQSGSGRHVWWSWQYGDWPAALDNSPAGANNNQYVMLATYATNPGPLDHIVVTPSTADIQVGGSQQFTATGYDQYGNQVPITPSWSTDVGSIDDNGLFTAQSTAGVSGYVKATVDAIEGQATVNIIAGYMPGDANGDGIVNSLDITKLKRIIMGLDGPTPGADATGDGNIDAMDITKIELIIMGG